MCLGSSATSWGASAPIGLHPQQVATGADTRDVAQRMFVSEHTVQDHLKSIFDKTGTRSWNRLLAIATGTEVSKS